MSRRLGLYRQNSKQTLSRSAAGIAYPGTGRAAMSGAAGVGNLILFVHGNNGPRAASSYAQSGSSDIDYVNIDTLTAQKTSYGTAEWGGGTASNSNFVVHAGGLNSSRNPLSAVFKCDSVMTISACSALTNSGYQIHSASSQKYALFMGGAQSYGGTSGFNFGLQAVAYDQSGTRVTAANIAQSVQGYSSYNGCYLANKGFRLSGYMGVASYTASLYNEDTLTMTTAALNSGEGWRYTPSTDQSGRSVLSIGDEAIVAPRNTINTVYMNKSLTVSDDTWQIPKASACAAIGKLGAYFGGDGSGSTVTQIDKSLTRQAATSMSSARINTSAAFMKKTCVVMGGISGFGDDDGTTLYYYSGTFDAYKV